jgi:hypothetical protein
MIAGYWVKSYRPIEPIAPPDVCCCSKTGHGFASQGNDAKGRRVRCLELERSRALFASDVQTFAVGNGLKITAQFPPISIKRIGSKEKLHFVP